jgi:hypothetical protein
VAAGVAYEPCVDYFLVFRFCFQVLDPSAEYILILIFVSDMNCIKFYTGILAFESFH